MRNDALGFASALAARPVKNAADFAAWRKDFEGKPVVEIVSETTRDFLARLAQADAQTLPALLDEAGLLQWYSFQSADGGVGSPESKITATGLATVRRKAAFDAGLPEKIAAWLGPNNPPEVAEKALTLAIQFLPGDDFMRKIAPDVQRILTTKSAAKARDYDFTLPGVLAYYDAPWATDVLLATVRAQYAAQPEAMISLLTNSRDARVIPALIAALAQENEGSWQRQPLNLALIRLTHADAGTNHSADWWRDWVKKNRASLPQAAQAEAFPELPSAESAREYRIARTRKFVPLTNDSKQGYWLVASGSLLKRKASTVPVHSPAAPPPSAFADVPMDSRPGLLVVFAEGDADGGGTRYWQNLVGRNFGGRYLAAVVPVASDSPASTPSAALAAQIARDVKAKYPVNPARVFLIGVGAGGQAVYASSLQPETPFAGFALVGSGFRPAALPPFARAKNRRYYLLQSPDDKRYPLFLAKAAFETLRKAGATAKLATYPLDPDAAQKAARDTVAAAIKWLEAQDK